MAGESPLDQLASRLPGDLRGFVQCTADTATITNGPVDWVEIPRNLRALLGGATRPELHISPGPEPSTAVLRVRAGWVSAIVTASVVDGRLAIDTSKLPTLAPRSIATEIQRFAEALNARFAANGKALAPPSFGAGGMTLTKVERAE